MTVRAMMCFIVFLPSLAAQHQSRLKVDIDATGEHLNKKPIVRSQKFAKWKGDALEPNTEVAAILADSMPTGPKVTHDKAAHGTPRKQIPASKVQIPAAQADAEGPTLAVLSAETSTARVTGAFQKKDSAKQFLVDAHDAAGFEKIKTTMGERPPLKCDYDDMNQCQLQAFYNETLPHKWPQWIAAYKEKEASKLARYSELLRSPTTKELVTTIGLPLASMLIETGVPSQEKAAKIWWHTQDHHQCDKKSKEIQPGPISNHFHFVEPGDRAKWISRESPVAPITHEDKDYWSLDQRERLLLDNIRWTLLLNDAKSVSLHDDTSCELALAKIDEAYLLMYRHEADMRFKSDICRTAVLYWEGGIYNDDDQVNYRPVAPYLKASTHFASSQAEHEPNEFFNSFMAATPCHPILLQTLELMRKTRIPGAPAQVLDVLKPEGLFGPHTLAKTYADFYGLEYGRMFESSVKNGTQLLKETHVHRLKTVNEEPFQGWVRDRHGKDCDFGLYDPEDQAIYACSRI